MWHFNTIDETEELKEWFGKTKSIVLMLYRFFGSNYLKSPINGIRKKLEAAKTDSSYIKKHFNNN